MMNPFFRLIRISITVLLFTFLTWMGLRWAGVNTLYQALDHPLLKPKFTLIAQGGEDLPPNSLAFFEKMQKLSPKILVKADVMMTKDAHLVLFRENNLKNLTNGTGFVHSSTLEELKKLEYKTKPELNLEKQNILTLEEYFQLFPHNKTLLNIAEQDPARIFNLKKIIETYDQKENLIFMSDYPEPLKFLRRESPRSLFSLPTTEYVQINVLSSLFLEPLARMKADLAVAPLKTKNNRTLLSERVVDEFKRRQIKLIVINNDSIPEWLKSKMDGVLTTRPENYLSQL